MSGHATATPTIQNRKARYQYDLLEEVECGIALVGPEVKSLRAGRASLDGAFAVVRGGEVFLRDCNITPYEQVSFDPPDPKRDRKLLLHRREIRKLASRTAERGLTLVPIMLYFNDRGVVKLRLAVARGKKLHDKRESQKTREARREMDRAARRRR